MRRKARSWKIETWMRGGIWSGCRGGGEVFYTSPVTFCV